MNLYPTKFNSYVLTFQLASFASYKCGISVLPPREEIKELIAANDAAIQEANSELSIIQQRLSHLRGLDSLYRSLESPIRKLSSELLGEIFERIVSSRPIDIGVLRDYIWDLMQVCSCWRNVVQETPKLWRAFKVGEMYLSSDAISIRLGYCFKLSRTVPLSIILSPSRLDLFPLSGVESILREIERVVFLSVAGFGTGLLKCIYSVTNTIEELPLLRKLEISGSCSFLHFFSSATELEEVTLKSFKLTDSVSQLSWKKVKKLKLVEMEGPDFNFIRLLQTTSLLEELIWIRNREECALGYGYEQEEDVELPFLRTLKFYQSEPSWLWSQTISVPSLTDVLIQNEDNKETDNLLDMIKRSGSIIKRLRMGCCRVSFGRRCIKELHDFEELTFPNTVDDILEPLLDKKIAYAPHLRKICISTSYVNDREFRRLYKDILPSIMRSRSISSLEKADKQCPRPLVPLESITCISPPHAHCSGPNDEVCIPTLRNLEAVGKELGIKFELTFQNCVEIALDAKYVDMTAEDKKEAENRVSDNIRLLELIRKSRLGGGLLSDVDDTSENHSI